MLRTFTFIAVALSTHLARTKAALDLSFGDDDDLTNFVTRPEIKTPKFNVTVYDADRVTPGYWFVAPYAMIFQEKHANKYYQPCQTGPSIYDGKGELVWSGACTVRNQNTCDFRAWNFNNTWYSSAILTPFRDLNDVQGHGIIMDNSFKTIGDLHVPTTMHNFNMHELNLVEDGTKALHIVHEPVEMDLSQIQQGRGRGWILDVGFREVNLMTGELVFEWWAARGGHVSLKESSVLLRGGQVRRNPWNWFHGNSVDKNQAGDYLISSRFTDTIFKVSGADGSVVWRLGGLESDFNQDFNFSRQHDARWLSVSDDKEVISFLDNSADDVMQTANHSTARIIEIDHSKKAATSIKAFPRPDQGVTRMRGNHQILPNGNSFVCWSENSYISEHDSEGQMIMEAQFASRRFVTYRAYKLNYTSAPTEPPVMKATVYGLSASRSTTVAHISWNGATEVHSWRFRDAQSQDTIGEKVRSGFETTVQFGGFYPQIFAEAIGRDGSVLGTSATVSIAPPFDWEDQVTFKSDERLNDKSPTKEPPRSQSQGGRRISVASDEVLAYTLFVVTVGMLCVAIWLWRCSGCWKASVRLRTDEER